MSNFQEWRHELLFVGNIVQDNDGSVSDEESERRFNRYIEMLEALDGSEGTKYAIAVFESVTAVDDYGAYQTAEHAARKFGEDAYCRALIQALPRLIRVLPDWAGDFLVSIANGTGTIQESVITTFNALLRELPDHSRCEIDSFIKAEENSGWLEERVGVLGSTV